tara:strand:+ start:3431 stop:5293 length:1863 start_codon:yes stop_codon:yes gene_type:complete
MCGIFVAIRTEGKSKFSIENCIDAVKCTSHRGPDNLDFYHDEICFMGHNRLSIVGLEEASNQPFEFDNHIIVFNGEIFNYIEIREELKKKGFTFTTNSDTEVLLKAFIFWGEKAFNKFNGMWSLAIYNKKNKSLTVSRDRFGQKPLFVGKEDDCLYFFSEPQQFSSINNPKPNYNLIRQFIREGSYDRKERKTFFTNIEEFPKAYNLEVGFNKNHSGNFYWSYPKKINKKVSSNFVDDFNDLLKDSVDLRLRADVDVGLLVSGGVDSTIIAGLVRENAGSDKQILAYSYSSDDKDDESKYASIISERLSISTKFLKQDKNAHNYIRRLKSIVKNLGRGHSSPAIISIDYLYEQANKDGLKVILDGQGADELLAGYKQYHFNIIFEQLLKFHFKQAFLNFKSFLSIGNQHDFGGIQGSFFVVIMFLKDIMPEFLKKIMRQVYGYEKILSSKKVKKENPILKPGYNKVNNKNYLNRHLINQHENGLENLLFYGDIVAMKNSVENRSPFMDHRLIEFAFESDEYLKVYNGIEKYVLKKNKIYKDFIDLLDRNKIGFSSNIRHKTKEVMIEQLNDSLILDWPIFKRKNFKKWIKSDEALLEKYERFLFRIFQVHLWNEVFIVKK